MNKSERNTAIKSVIIILSLSLVLAFIVVLFQWPNLSAMIIPIGIIIIMILRFIMKGDFDNLFYLIYLGALILSALILSYNFITSNYESNKLSFYISSAIFIMQIIIYFIILFFEKIKKEKID